MNKSMVVLTSVVLILCVAAGLPLQQVHQERPRWEPQSWILPLQTIEARVWFNDDEQCWEWSVLTKPKVIKPENYKWQTGRSKTAAEAKEAAEKAVEELGVKP